MEVRLPIGGKVLLACLKIRKLGVEEIGYYGQKLSHGALEWMGLGWCVEMGGCSQFMIHR